MNAEDASADVQKIFHDLEIKRRFGQTPIKRIEKTPGKHS